MLFRLVFLKWRLLRLLDGSVAPRVWGTRTARMSPPLLSRRSSKKEARHVTLGDFLYREVHSSSVSFVAGALPLPESQNRTHCCPSRIGKRGGPNILSKAGEELHEFFAIDERDHLQVGVCEIRPVLVPRGTMLADDGEEEIAPADSLCCSLWHHLRSYASLSEDLCVAQKN